MKTTLQLFYALPVVLVLGICGYAFWVRATHQGPPVRHMSAKPFISVPIGGLTANLFAAGDHLEASAAGNDLFIEFRDAQSNLTDVGKVTLELNMSMPDMVMHSIGVVMRTATPGQYRTKLDAQMAGDWKALLGFTGPRGTFQTNFYVTAVK